jgi:hypothetical protein
VRWSDSATAWTYVGLRQHREVSCTDLQRAVQAIEGLPLRDDAGWKQVGAVSQPYAPIQKFHPYASSRARRSPTSFRSA